MAHLRSLGKGANKTPLDEAAWPSLAERRAAGSPAAARRRLSCRAPRERDDPSAAKLTQPAQVGCGRTDGQKGTTHVTTMSSAEPTRRDFLYIATASVAGIGAAAVLVPLITQMNPDASTIAAGAPSGVDLFPLAAGRGIKGFWRGKPNYFNHRPKKEIEEARKDDVATRPG